MRWPLSGLLPRRSQRGVGLAEVLIAILVVAIGTIALVRLQGTSLRQGSNAKARSLAAELAREKLDDLHNFSTLAAGAAGVFGYDEIAANVGGAENPDGTLRLPTGVVTFSNTQYNRTWTSVGYYYCGAAAPTTANCAGVAAKDRPDYKLVTLTVTWTDQDGSAAGQAQTLALQDSISSISPTSGASSLISGISIEAPLVGYKVGLAPEVLAIDLGGDQKKETTNPTPQLTKKGNQEINTIARYETIRYSSTTNTITRESFTTLNCTCRMIASGSRLNVLGEEVTGRRGEPVDNDQAVECTVCCRDHHDDNQACDPNSDTGRKNCYDPFRNSSDFLVNGDHKHYDANLVLKNNIGDIYVEACRLQRVDGLLRTTQDWNLAAISAIPQDFFAPGGTPNTTNINNYGEWIRDFVNSHVAGTAPPSKIWPTSITIPKGNTAQVAARGLYIDYMDNAAKAAFAARIAGSDQTVFQEIPFYEVNLTKLAQWDSDDIAVATVRNDQLVTEQVGQSLYKRGIVSGVNFGITNVDTSTFTSNTGVINEFIKTDPADASNPAIDIIQIVVPGANPVLSGTISPDAPGTIVRASNGGTCTYDTGTNLYSCTLPFGWSGTITPDGGTAFTFAPVSRTYSNLVANQSGQDFVTTVVTTTFQISGTISGNPSTVNFSTSSGATCTYNAVGAIYTCTVPEGWSGTITPSTAGRIYTPLSYTYSNVVASDTNEHYTTAVDPNSFVISGLVSPAVTSVTFAITNGAGPCTYNSSSGAYACAVPGAWTGSITPTASSISFEPLTRSYANVGADVSGENFASLASSFTIAGKIAEQGTNAIFSSISVTTNNGGGPCTYDGTTGVYSCTVPAHWSGSVQPMQPTKSFAPSARAYTNVTSNFVSENYTYTNQPPINFTISGTISGFTTGKSAPGSVTGVTPAVCTTTRVPASGTYVNTVYSCSISIAGGSTWSGSVTVNPSGTGNITLTPNDLGINKKGSKTFTGISSSQTVNFTCTGNGC